MTLILLAALAGVIPQQYTVGQAVPRVEIVDDSGRTRSLDSLQGAPTLLVPMYTRCPLACPTLVASLKRGVAESAAPADSYRVVLFSFDPRDTPADLRAFREHQRVPLAWTVATARPADARRLMESIGFRWTDAGGSIFHPNLVVALSPELKAAKYLFGTEFSGREIDAALSIARGGHDWIGRWGAYGLAALLLLAVFSAVYLLHQLTIVVR
jgi:protein SCO1/2